MRVKWHNVTAIASIFTSALFLLKTLVLLNDFEDYPNNNLKQKIDMRENHEFYEILPETNDSWSMYDIRRGRRSNSKSIIGITDSDNFDLNIGPETLIRASSSNRTVNSNILIYNRVPKCASTSIQSLLRFLAKKNGFKFESSSIYWK